MNQELVIQTKPKSNISEDIRTIRTNLQFTSTDDDTRVFLVTSSIPGEGKSFISSNLAVAFAQTGKTTLLVDSDLRLGRINKIFDVSNKLGLSNLLLEKDPAAYREYVRSTAIENLYVIPRGVVPPNPSELLNSNNCKRIVQVLKKAFDYVIFDGVPINGLPDSLIVAGLVDRVILIASSGYTKSDDLNDAKKALEKIDANVAGVVLNNVAKTKRGKYSYYYE